MTIEIDDLIQAHDAVTQIAKVEGAVNSTYEMLQDTLELKSRTAVDTWVRDRKAALLRYMNAQGRDPIDAGEIGVRAVIKGRSSGARYDIELLLAVPGGVEAIIEAAKHGHLSVNDKALAAFRKDTAGASWADLLWRFRTENGRDEWVQLEWEKP